MSFRHFLIITPVAALLASALPAQTADPLAADPEELRARAESFFEELVAELELTDDQAAEVQAIYAANEDERSALMQEMQAIRDSGGSRRDRFRRMKDLRAEMQAQQQATRAELAEVLTDEQMSEFDAIMDARREEMRERIRQGRSG